MTEANSNVESVQLAQKKETEEKIETTPVRDKVIAESRRVSLARTRLEMLFDEGTLEEIGSEVMHRSHDFGLEKKRIPGDGVVTACGMVEGRPVYAFAQDRTVLGGSLGEAHSQKIARLQDLALRTGAPFIAIHDSGGARHDSIAHG